MDAPCCSLRTVQGKILAKRRWHYVGWLPGGNWMNALCCSSRTDQGRTSAESWGFRCMDLACRMIGCCSCKPYTLKTKPWESELKMQILCRSQLEMLVLPWHHFRLYAPHLAPHMYCQTSQTSLSHLDSHCAFFFGPTHPCVGQTVMCFLLLTVASLVILFQLILFLAGLFFLF